MTDSTRTKAQLRVAVASKLQILNAGNVVNGNDVTPIDYAIDNVLRELENEGLIPFDITDNYIEVNLINSLAVLIANTLVTDFALDDAMSMRIGNEAAQAMNKMRGQNWQGTITQTTKTDYF
jgi:uncharacterized membrane protein